MKSNLIKDLDKYALEVLSPLNILKKFRIEIGVWDTSFNREILDEDGNKSTPESQEGISNAQLMYIHEFGGIHDRPPKRPILELTINHGYELLRDEYWDKLVNGILNENWSEYEIKNCLRMLASEMEGYCREAVMHNEMGLRKLAESTIAKRRNHSDVPLWDTGQLVKSVRCRVVKI